MASARFGPFLSAIETPSRSMIRPMGMPRQITTDASALKSFPFSGCICKGRDKGTARPIRRSWLIGKSGDRDKGTILFVPLPKQALELSWSNRKAY
jgi:hypothetical protein